MNNNLTNKYELNKRKLNRNISNIGQYELENNNSPYVLDKINFSKKYLNTHYSCNTINNINNSNDLNKIISETLISDSKYFLKNFNNNKSILVEIYEYYYKKIIDCNQVIKSIQELIKYSKLINSKFELMKISKIKTKLVNPDPLNIIKKKNKNKITFTICLIQLTCG